MPRPRDARLYGAPSREPLSDVRNLGSDREKRDRLKRRLEREVFDSATRGLTRPLLRPKTGAPLRPNDDDASHPLQRVEATARR